MSEKKKRMPDKKKKGIGMYGGTGVLFERKSLHPFFKLVGTVRYGYTESFSFYEASLF